MAFSDYIKDGFDDVHFVGGFQHSDETLPPLADGASDADKAARSAKAMEIAKSIGERFDAEYAEPARVVTEIFQSMQQYGSAPAPVGALPIPPAAELFERQGTALQQCVAVAQAYDADARKLAEAGAPKLKEYIDKLAADSKGALETLRAIQKAGIPSGPANYGAAPGAMTLDPYGQYVPMGPMGGPGPVWPMPYGGPGQFTPSPFSNPFGPPGGYMPMPMPAMPGMGGPMAPFPQMPAMGGGMTPEQLKIMNDSNREVNKIMADTNASTVASYEAINKKWSNNF